MVITTNLEELQMLVKKMSGKESNADSIADAIREIREAYSTSASGSNVSIVGAKLFPNSNDVITNGIILMSDGTNIDMTIEYIPEFDVTSNEGSIANTTSLTVNNTLSKGNSYVYTFDRSPALPAIGEDSSAYMSWDGTSDIECDDGVQITLIEVDANKRAIKAGIVVATIKY